MKNSKFLNCMNMNQQKMLNPGLSALWEEEIKRRNQACILKEMESPDLEGTYYLIYFNFIFIIYYNKKKKKERTNLLKIDNEIDFKHILINLLEARYYLI